MNVANNYFIITAATTPGLIQVATGRTYVESVTINTIGAAFKLIDGTSGVITSGTTGVVTGIGTDFAATTAAGYYRQNVTYANGLRLKLITAAGNTVIAYRQ